MLGIVGNQNDFFNSFLDLFLIHIDNECIHDIDRYTMCLVVGRLISMTYKILFTSRMFSQQRRNNKMIKLQAKKRLKGQKRENQSIFLVLK